MGATDAMAVGTVAGLPFLLFFFTWVYLWVKRNQRFDEEVMLDCARRSGGAYAETLIRQQLAQVEGDANNVDADALASRGQEAWPATSRKSARALGSPGATPHDG
jgi:hypothetical protein